MSARRKKRGRERVSIKKYGENYPEKLNHQNALKVWEFFSRDLRKGMHKKKALDWYCFGFIILIVSFLGNYWVVNLYKTTTF